MNIFANQTITNFINKPGVRKFATQMSNRSAFLPIILLESTVIAGRSYQAYKRGGKTECRERVIDETLTAIVWIGVITWLNSLMSKIIKTKGVFDKKGLPEIDVDLGSDAIRNPLKEALKKRPEIKNKLCSLKLMKILGAASAGVYISGFLLPKFYQNLTKKILDKEKKQRQQAKTQQSHNKVTLNEFLQKTTTDKNNKVSFGTAATFIHALENNPVCQLLTNDAGIFAGRAYNSRNNDERFEFLFRDMCSSFFYMFSTPLVYSGLSKWADKFKGKNTNLDPQTTQYVTDIFIKKLDGKSMNIEQFKNMVLGSNRALAERIIHTIHDEVIGIEDFRSLIADPHKGMVQDKKLASDIMNRAEQFLKLRPASASKNLLTVSEVINSVIGGTINDAAFIDKAVDTAKGIANLEAKQLAEAKVTKFISFKEIDKIKTNILHYTESILEYAKSKGATEITSDILTQARNRNFICKVAYTVSGLAVSALFLSTLIPKLQYKLTELRTGNKEFPGIRDIK